MSDADDKGFLDRWSRRKQQARDGQVDDAARALDGNAAVVTPAAHSQPGAAAAAEDKATGKPASGESQPMPGEDDFADVDFAALDATSDYKRFMGANVPDAIRQKALTRLWTSDPLFAGLDPHHDYHGDYTDAAVAVKEGIKTAYQVGRGFLSDEEVAAWENLGKPVPDKTPVSPEKVAEAEPRADGKDGLQSIETPPAAVAAAAAGVDGQERVSHEKAAVPGPVASQDPPEPEAALAGDGSMDRSAT